MEVDPTSRNMFIGGGAAFVVTSALTLIAYKAFETQRKIALGVGGSVTAAATCLTPLVIYHLAQDEEDDWLIETLQAILSDTTAAQGKLEALSDEERYEVLTAFTHIDDQTTPKAIAAAYFAAHPKEIEPLIAHMVKQRVPYVEQSAARLGDYLSADPEKIKAAIATFESTLTKGSKSRILRTLVPILGGDVALDFAVEKGDNILLEHCIETVGSDASEDKLLELWKNPKIRDQLLAFIKKEETLRTLLEPLSNEDFLKLFDRMDVSDGPLHTVFGALLEEKDITFENLQEFGGLLYAFSYHTEWCKQNVTEADVFGTALDERPLVSKAAREHLGARGSPMKTMIRRQRIDAAQAIDLTIARSSKLAETARAYLKEELKISIDHDVLNKLDPLTRALRIAISHDEKARDLAIAWIQKHRQTFGLLDRALGKIGEEPLQPLLVRTAKTLGLTDAAVEPLPQDHPLVLAFK